MPHPPIPDRSMEEIIASISRIIAEDTRPSDPARAASPAPQPGILELTEAIAADGSVRHLAGVEMARTRAAPRNEPGSPEPVGAKADTAEQAGEPLLSTAASAAAATAFARLGAIPRRHDATMEVAVGDCTRTLEDIVRDSLRPLLQGWLDEHLPGIVERLVREAIARVVTEAGHR